jgi:predicted phosphoribosyltransferase
MERAFPNRIEAGRLLAEKLEKYADRDDVIVLGLPRGGVPVANEVAKRLRAPLDVFIVRKLGVPGFEELAAGAIASGGVRVLNEDVVRAIPHADQAIEAVTARETAELQRREQIYREGRPAPELRDRIAILVDDGLATGATMRAAVKALRQRGAAKIVVAVPVGPPDTCHEIEEQADETICRACLNFSSSRPVLRRFRRQLMKTCASCLQCAKNKEGGFQSAPLKRRLEPRSLMRTSRSKNGGMKEVQFRLREQFSRTLIFPRTQVTCAFCSRQRQQPSQSRNQFVARTLNDAGLATLLFDLLTREEEAIDMQTRELVQYPFTGGTPCSRDEVGKAATTNVRFAHWLFRLEHRRRCGTGRGSRCSGCRRGRMARRRQIWRVKLSKSAGTNPAHCRRQR